jgi:hypothetical protein
MPEPVMTLSFITGLLTKLALEAGKGAAGKAGQNLWQQLSSTAAQAWKKIRDICQGDAGAERALEEFTARPDDNSCRDSLAQHIQRAGERRPAEAKELVTISGDVYFFQQAAEKIITVQHVTGNVTFS